MFKLEVGTEDIQQALLDYYKGSVARARIEAETLYDIANKQIKEKSYNLPPQGFGEKDIQQLSHLMSSIPKGLTKEEYVESYVAQVKENIRKKLTSGNLVDVKIPSKRKITIDMMLETEKKRSDRTNNAIIEAEKKMDLEFGKAITLLGFSWPGMTGAIVAGFANFALNSIIIGYFSGALLFSTLCNIPNIIKFVKGFSAAYKDEEKLGFFNDYYRALDGLKWMDDFFKGLAEEFRSNVAEKKVSPQSIRR